ncbi:MAG: hypothetical protein DI555_20805 [Novosphingobium pentaromativorans]|uniref:Uncharacterized protein n=1 Tax=Novosphingobium pentaromativorans TaxID=205844 RepID=A0A2W5QK38_9SPHN|nr:MAG: hypothetical protein DI555_20805 [Novosphingobium pentaromativorans]
MKHDGVELLWHAGCESRSCTGGGRNADLHTNHRNFAIVNEREEMISASMANRVFGGYCQRLEEIGLHSINRSRAYVVFHLI